MRLFVASCAVGVVAIAPQARAGFAIFTDTSFWDGVDHTLIDFETEPGGTSSCARGLFAHAGRIGKRSRR